MGVRATFCDTCRGFLFGVQAAMAVTYIGISGRALEHNHADVFV